MDILRQLRDQEKAVKRQAKLRAIFGDVEMKFSHSIQFNAVPDWSSHYIAYSNLKKLIYTLEKEVNQRNQSLTNDAESSPLLDFAQGDPDRAFSQALDKELDNITAFYQTKSVEIFDEVVALRKDEEEFEADLREQNAEDDADGPHERRRSTTGFSKMRRSSIFKDWGFPNRRRTSVTRPILGRIDSDDSDEEDDPASRPLRRTKTQESSGSAGRTQRRGSEDIGESTYSHDFGATLKKRMINLYVSLCELKSYIQLNKTGFTKVLKKYDKTLDRNLKSSYISMNITDNFTFRQTTTDKVSDHINQVEHTYANLNCSGDVEQAKRELRLDLREHVVWERNTVWREMIGIERKAQAANLGIRRTILGNDSDPNQQRRQGDDEKSSFKALRTPLGSFYLPLFLFNTTFYVLIAAVLVFVLLLVVPIMRLPEQQNCLAMVVFVSLLWATEVIKLLPTLST